MDISVFFKPVDSSIYSFLNEGAAPLDLSLIHTKDNTPELEGVKMALIGVEEDRHGEANKGCSQGPDIIRKHFYKLFTHDKEVKLADLGNIQQGETYEDTVFALKSTCFDLLRAGIIPVVLGGSQDLTHACYAAYEKLEQTVNLVTIDGKLDFGKGGDEISSSNYLNSIVLHQPNYLFNYSNIGHQRYLVDNEIIDLMGKMYFDIYRLGEMNAAIQDTEPVIRNADLLSFDVSAMRHSDAPGSFDAGPNGLYGEQACQICKYAGISDKLTSFGIYEYNPDFDRREITAQLIAQMLWYFVEGYNERKNDNPFGKKDAYIKYTISLKDDTHQIVFYKSKKTDRWWMDVPYPAGKKNKYERHHLVPCTYSDYQLASNEEMPDRWWKTFQKLT